MNKHLILIISLCSMATVFAMEQSDSEFDEAIVLSLQDLQIEQNE